MAYTRATSLNGYWERMRKLLRMLGGDSLPEGLQGVVIVGDSREAGASNVSYRRFGCATVVAAVVANQQVKFRADADLVLTRVTFGFQTNATSASELRLMTPAQVIADNTAVYAALTAANGGWLDTPDGSAPPLSLAANGATGLGSLVHRWACGAIGAQTVEEPIYLPSGSALTFMHPNNAITLVQMSLQGYVR